MLLRRFFTVMLLTLLVFMQAASLAHSTEHLLTGEDSHCAACALGQQFKQTVSSSKLTTGTEIHTESAATGSSPRSTAVVTAVFQPRAPPAFPELIQS